MSGRIKYHMKNKTMMEKVKSITMKEILTEKARVVVVWMGEK